MRFECKQCGRCCQPGWGKKEAPFQYVIIHDFEIERIAAYLRLTIDQLKNDFRIVRNVISVAHVACPFYQNKQSIIHAVKPDGCKKWPWIKMHDKIEKVKESAAFCPGININQIPKGTDTGCEK